MASCCPLTGTYCAYYANWLFHFSIMCIFYILTLPSIGIATWQSLYHSKCIIGQCWTMSYFAGLFSNALWLTSRLPIVNYAIFWQNGTRKLIIIMHQFNLLLCKLHKKMEGRCPLKTMHLWNGIADFYQTVVNMGVAWGPKLQFPIFEDQIK